VGCFDALKDPPAFRAVSTDATPVPNWELGGLKVDDSCATLLDYCVSVSCDVESKGKVKGDTTVTVFLEQDSGEIEHHVPVTLEGGQKQTLSHKFSEARLFGSTPKGGCRVAFKGVDVTCSFQNMGGVGAENIRAEVILSDGSAKHKSGSLTIPERGVKEHTFFFEGLSPKDAIRSECSATPTK